MKEIRYSRQFTRRYKQRIARDERLKQDFSDSVDAFQEDRTLVDDHPLENIMEGQRAFSINDAYRVVYVETDDEFVFLDIGTHEQVYRR
jgi:addiction module RelE/StbE family toxin